MFLYVALAGLVAVVACFGLLDDVWHNRLQQGSRQDPRTYKIVTGVLVAIALLVAWWFTAERAINIGNDTANYVELFLSFREGIQPGRRYESVFRFTVFWWELLPTTRMFSLKLLHRSCMCCWRFIFSGIQIIIRSPYVLRSASHFQCSRMSSGRASPFL